MRNPLASDLENIGNALFEIADALRDLGTARSGQMNSVEFLALNTREGAAEIAGAIRKVLEAAAASDT